MKTIIIYCVDNKTKEEKIFEIEQNINPDYTFDNWLEKNKDFYDNIFIVDSVTKDNFIRKIKDLDKNGYVFPNLLIHFYEKEKDNHLYVHKYIKELPKKFLEYIGIPKVIYYNK